MSVNEEIVDQFKKSLSAAVKSIGKSQEIEVDFIDDEPSIDGNKINLKIPNISSIKNNINYLRAEADSLALEARLHDSKIHQKYISYNNIGDKIFKVIGECEEGRNIYALLETPVCSSGFRRLN